MASNYVSYANATELMTEIGNKFKALNSAYKFRGSSLFANLPTTLTAAMEGYVYNVSDEFTTTSLFVEGDGKKYPANTNVAVANVGDSETPVFKYDVIGSFVDVQGILDQIQAVSDMIAGEFDDTEDYAIGDIVVHDGALYKFDAAHTAGDWDDTEVAATSVEELIASAEPASLTTAQVEALLALLD